MPRLVTEWKARSIAWRLISAIALYLFVLAVVSIVALVLSRSGIDSSRPEASSLAEPPEGEAAYMMTSPRVDYSQQRLLARAYVYLSRQALLSLEDGKGHTLMVEEDGRIKERPFLEMGPYLPTSGSPPPSLSIFPVYGDFSRVIDCDNPPSDSQQVDLYNALIRATEGNLLTPINTASGFASEALEVSAPVIGTGASFPQDSYVMSDPVVVICWPAGFHSTTQEGQETRALLAGVAGILPTRELASNPAQTSFSGFYLPPSGPLASTVLLSQGTPIAFHRTLASTFLIWMIGASPALLAVTALLQWRDGRRQQRGSVAVPIELGAALLAILPLRQVLVPGDITGLTWLDYLLAIEVLGIIVLIVLMAMVAAPKR